MFPGAAPSPACPWELLCWRDCAESSGTSCYSWKRCVCLGKAKPGQSQVCTVLPPPRAWPSPGRSSHIAVIEGRSPHPWRQSSLLKPPVPGWVKALRLPRLFPVTSPGHFVLGCAHPALTAGEGTCQAGSVRVRLSHSQQLAPPVSDGAGDSQCCDSGVNANEAGRNESN